MGSLAGKNGFRRRSLRIAAEVRFVNAEEAKQLIAAEGYSVVDVRDKTQFERAHIKSCRHIPLFIFNEDNDLGKKSKPRLRTKYSRPQILSDSLSVRKLQLQGR